MVAGLGAVLLFGCGGETDEARRGQLRMLVYTSETPDPPTRERLARVQQLSSQRQEELQALGYVALPRAKLPSRSEPLLASLRLRPSLPAPVPLPLPEHEVSVR